MDVSVTLPSATSGVELQKDAVAEEAVIDASRELRVPGYNWQCEDAREFINIEQRSPPFFAPQTVSMSDDIFPDWPLRCGR